MPISKLNTFPRKCRSSLIDMFPNCEHLFIDQFCTYIVIIPCKQTLMKLKKLVLHLEKHVLCITLLLLNTNSNSLKGKLCGWFWISLGLYHPYDFVYIMTDFVKVLLYVLMF